MILKAGIAVAILVAIVWASTLGAQQANAPNYGKAEVRKMIREAHTPDQYRALANYFRAQQLAYRNQAKSEVLELERRWQFMSGPAAKYPRPVDSSRYRYEYFMYEAEQMNQRAIHYERLSAITQ